MTTGEWNWYIMRSICPKCRKYRAAPGRVHCEVCLKQERECSRRRRARLMAAGLCVRCGKAPARPGYTMCFACAVKTANNEAARKARRENDMHREGTRDEQE